jgi:PST family polysaccharide transporter
MIEAYPILIILSFTIIGWLVVDSYMNFVFIPQKKYYYVTQNKLVALISFIIIGLPATLLTNSMYALIISLTLSSFCEVIYCRYLILKNKLLEFYDLKEITKKSYTIKYTSSYENL